MRNCRILASDDLEIVSHAQVIGRGGKTYLVSPYCLFEHFHQCQNQVTGQNNIEGMVGLRRRVHISYSVVQSICSNNQGLKTRVVLDNNGKFSNPFSLSKIGSVVVAM